MKAIAHSLRTQRQGLTDITKEVRVTIRESGVQDGLCLVYCPHTTAAITINENTDPHVGMDILDGLNRAFPDSPQFLHLEGNSSAHLKSSCVGASVTVMVESGEPVLGIWQGIYFCEFDGPRNRTYYIKVT